MLWRAALLLLLVVIAYIPALQGDFIWDDNKYVSENPTLARPDGLRQIWFRPKSTPQYYPLVFTTFWLEYQVWGLWPAGYHFDNILLHGLNAGLLWLLLSRLRVPFPWFAAAIFALHPVHVESVAWITERKNVLSGFFYFISFLAFLRFSPPDRPPARDAIFWYAVSLLAFVAALLSKTVTCSLPAVLVLVYWWKRGRPTRREILVLAPMFAIGLVLAMHTAKLERDFVGASGAAWTFTPVERCLIAGRALWFYVGKLLWPYPLIFNYERWHIDAHDPWQYGYPLAALAVFIILAWPNTPLPLPKFLMPLRKLGKGPLTACLIFAGTLLPALGFFNVYPMIYYFAADHFQYLASIAMICLAMGAIEAFEQWRKSQRRLDFLDSPHVPRPAICAGIVLLTLGCLTWRQCYVYFDLDTLWQDTRTKNPSAWMAHYNFGTKQAKEGNFDLANECFAKTVEIDPHCVNAYNNWATVLRAQAVEAELAANKTKDTALAVEKLAEAKDKYDLAVAKIKLAIKYDRDNNPKLHFFLGSTYLMMKKYELAIEPIEKALEAIDRQPPERNFATLVPDYESALAFALLHAGRREEALTHAQRAVDLRPEDAEYRSLLEQVRNSK